MTALVPFLPTVILPLYNDLLHFCHFRCRAYLGKEEGMGVHGNARAGWKAQPSLLPHSLSFPTSHTRKLSLARSQSPLWG